MNHPNLTVFLLLKKQVNSVFFRLKGSCVHITAMFFCIEAAVRGGYTNPACTSKVCTWNVPAQITIVQPVQAKEMNFKASKLNKCMETLF